MTAPLLPTPTVIRYQAAIARRNIAWAKHRRRQDAWLAAGHPADTVAIGMLNLALDDLEWAQRELIRERVIFRAAWDEIRRFDERLAAAS